MVYIFIINPVAGMVDRTEEIRRALERRNDIQSIIFNTEDAGHEETLMKEMFDIFDDERVRIIICGGSGTLSNAINSLEEKDLDHVEIGFYPCGLTNDFLKNFGNDAELFNDLNAVIDGNVVPVDFYRCYEDYDKKKVFNELLFTAVGIPAVIQDVANKLNLIGRIRPSLLYGVSSLICTPFTRAVEYQVWVDGKTIPGEYKVMYFANSICLGGGFFPIRNGVSCQDGVMNVLLLRKFSSFKSLSYLMDFMRGTLTENHSKDVYITSGKKISFRRKDGKPMIINSDGEIYRVNRWDMEMVQNGLKFVAPNGAKIIDSDECFKIIEGESSNGRRN